MLLFSRSFFVIPLFVAFYCSLFFFFLRRFWQYFCKLNILSQQLVKRFLESLTAQSIKRVKGHVSERRVMFSVFRSFPIFYSEIWRGHWNEKLQSSCFGYESSGWNQNVSHVWWRKKVKFHSRSMRGSHVFHEPISDQGFWRVLLPSEYFHWVVLLIIHIHVLHFGCCIIVVVSSEVET